ncbi:MAG: zinc ABC transporter solute-binding protein [Erysipelothrix sp.]|nr:zinc ABC transporter solute-binding protein [Erysipelothrix sp.]
MKKFISLLSVLFILTACSSSKPDTKNDKLSIVTSYTILEDMVHQIGKELVDIHNLVPSGTDPHEYEPLPNDIKQASDADILLYNGLNLEGGEHGWFMKLARSVNKDTEKIHDLSLGITPLSLFSDDNVVDEINPHAYLSPKNGLIMVENVLKILIENDVDNKDIYEENAQAYIKTLNDIDLSYRKEFDTLESKVLVTSERAFQYMNKEYGLEEGYIWQIDTEETGTAKQIKELTAFIKEKDVKILFLESNVDPRPMETVSQESGVPIYKEHLYSDDIGSKGSAVDTYEKLLIHNLEAIIGGLK